MSRLPRLKIKGCEATYHLSARTSALRGEYPLSDPVMSEKLVEFIKFYTSVYFCTIFAYNILGNHYHLVLKFDEPKLCLNCHDPTSIFKNVNHADIENESCSLCHNPHGGSDHFILN